MSERTGISAGTLLRMPELYKKVTEGLKVSESMAESWKRGFFNFFGTRSLGGLGTDRLFHFIATGKLDRDKLFKEADAIQQEYLQEPLRTDAYNWIAEGTGSIMGQGLSTGVKSGLGAGAGAVVGALAGHFIGPGGAAVLGKFGAKVGATLVSFNDLFRLQAGTDFIEFLRMKDENGQPIDAGAAALAAIMTGGLTAATEMYGVPKVMRLLGFGGLADLMDFGVTKDTARQMLASASGRAALQELAKNYLSGVTWGGINNAIEALGHDLGIVTAQEVSGQPFPRPDIDWFGDILKGLATSAHFAAAGLPALAFRTGKIARQTQQFRQGLEKVASATELAAGTVREAFKQAVQDTAAPEAQTEAQTEIQAEAQTGPEAQTDIQTETQAEPAAQEAEPEAQSDYIFIPRDELEAYRAEHPDVIGDIGIPVGHEIMLTTPEFEAIGAAAPDLLTGIGDKIRYGADGATIEEAVKKLDITDANEAGAFHSEENRKFMKQVEEQALQAGSDEQEAKDLALVMGSINAGAIESEGETLPDITMNAVEEEQGPQNFDRLGADYDINNPETWPDTERREAAREFQAFAQIPDVQKSIKDILDILTGRKSEKAEELEQKAGELVQGLQDEAPERPEAKFKALIRQEYQDYLAELNGANQDAADALANFQGAPERYESNAAFPKGKSKNPTERYYFGNYNGQTRIDIATEGADLFVRIKSAGSRDSTVLKIKNYRRAVLREVLADVLSGETRNGAALSETPAGQYMARALSSFWTKTGLLMANIPVKGGPVEGLNAGVSGGPVSQFETPETQGGTDFNASPSVNGGTEFNTPPSVNGGPVEEITTQVNGGTDFNASPAVNGGTDFNALPPVNGGPVEGLSIGTNGGPVEGMQPPQVRQAQIESPTAREKMPVNARYNLAQDEAAWKKTVDGILDNPDIGTNDRHQVAVMRTPLVLMLAGAEHLPVRVNMGKLKLILRDHPEMSREILKDIPRALTDPVAIFQSEDGAGNGLVVMTELKDKSGASVIVAFHLNQKGDINKLASGYGKGKKSGGSRVEWFQKQVENGNLLYVNKEKAEQWGRENGVTFPGEIPADTEVKTERDLLRLWEQYESEGYYQRDAEGNPVGYTRFTATRAVIDLMKNANTGTKIHELGHVTFRFMENLAKAGSLRMQEDLRIILEHAGVTQEEWDADTKRAKGGAREKAHEYFADAFTVYVWEGKAPTKQLQGVFDRLRQRLLKIYDDIHTQLGIELDDEMRAVFDRLLTMPDSDSRNVGEAAIEEVRLQNQIDGYRQQLRQAEAEMRNAREASAQLELEGDAGAEISPRAAEQVEELIWSRELDDLQAEETQQVMSTAEAIKQFGGLRYEDVKRLLGPELAKDVYNRWRSLFRGKKGLDKIPYDVMLQQLQAAGFQFDSDSLLEWLRNNKPGKPEKSAPALAVNNDTVNALLGAVGVQGARDYLNERLQYLNRLAKQTGQTGAAQEIQDIKEYRQKLDRVLKAPGLDEDARAPKRERSPQEQAEALARKTAEAGYKMGAGVERTKAEARRQADRAAWQKRLENIKATMKEARERGEDRIQTRLQNRINTLQQRINRLTEYQRQASTTAKITKMVNGILKMSKSRIISALRMDDIRALLDSFDLRKTGRGRRENLRDLLNNMVQDISEMTGAERQELGITPEDVNDLTGKIHLEDMTLGEVNELYTQVKELYQQGRREFAEWKQNKRAKAEAMQKEMAEALEKTEGPAPRVPQGSEDMSKKFRFGKPQELLTGLMFVIRNPHQFLSILAGTPAQYENAFNRFFMDITTKLKGAALDFKHQREAWMQERLQELGLRIDDFDRIATTLDGIDYRWTSLHKIYLAMQNSKAAAAVLWGNFVKNKADMNKLYPTVEAGMNAINKLMDFLMQHPEQIKAAELMVTRIGRKAPAFRRGDISPMVLNGPNAPKNHIFSGVLELYIEV